ncbi:uncharacterized protein MONOS_7709 [Monocercomonoides exilis]|uniref:uncharacterized protein n=1 Tax=Monocercomonoides exilis TaxID=2049356 RepID=UPI003559AD49|nr:hypothetical protein MONOS_7709 [Monocercomonoides exilis]|eukprot:MONOS_7709.1-p1 / transcript=MONOS_7709.1 / gene=MONOS_7709 / organism=Monocercomonoides_exilis_PA203 / gene_product=unspecified product / transcript_product=unspecified product / location=Mono_scaffold00270:47344-48132(-) / protein_length=244 / sequence_SO=supercontig / SO=protein_coding / is_pseudo=false
MNEQMEEMNKDKFESVFSEELFNKIHQMIEEEKLSMGNAILLLKHVGYWKALKSEWANGFLESSLSKRIRKMMIDENEKKERKDENLLANLCKCYISLSCNFSPKVISICVPLLLRDALNNEESEEAHKDVEMALIALGNIVKNHEEKDCLFLNEITEIIKHNLVHRNLTHFACQLAWDYFVGNADLDWETKSGKFFGAFFAREAVRELKELKSCVCWEKKKKRKGKKAKGRKGRKEKLIIKR